MNARLQPELYLIGLGVMIPEHVTAQAIRALSRCSQIYTLIRESPHLWIPADKLGQIEIIDVLNWYVEGEVRTHNYDYVARKIYSALSPGKNVGYVTYGNPMAYDSVAQNLISLCEAAGLRAHIVPGISSLETVLCDLRRDIAPGIQVYDASWLVACEIQPRVDVPLLLVQIDTFGSFRTHYNSLREGDSLKELVQHCCRFYPTQHSVYLVRSRGDETRPAHIMDVRLSQLCDVTGEELRGTSLYFPASHPGQHLRKKILARMEQT
jgi:hypothetical protein